MSEARSRLLARRTRRPVVVDGETVAHVRALSLAELKAFGAEVEGLKDDAEVNLKSAARLFVLTACDEVGGRLFADGEDAQFEGMDPAILRAVVETAAELNGLSGEKKS